MKKQIVIVGAGPVGCYTARLLRRRGFSPVVLEEHKQIGRPVHCAGVVGNQVFTDTRLALSRHSVINHLDGAVISYGKNRFEIKRKTAAYLINREVFDRELGKGLDVHLETKFLGFHKLKKGYLIETDRGEYAADILIGADGARSYVREAGRFKADISYKRGAQFRIKLNMKLGGFVEVHLKRPYFSWLIPEGDGIVKAGIISNNPFSDLKDFLKQRNIKGEIINKFGGIIPEGSCQTVKENIALVGDAACQLKPLTHGGIYYGLRSAEILADCITNNELRSYDKKWRKCFGREIERAYRAGQIYKSLSDRELTELFGLISDNARIIEEVGDFEKHSKVLVKIMKDPRTQKKISGMLWKLLSRNLL